MVRFIFMLTVIFLNDNLVRFINVRNVLKTFLTKLMLGHLVPRISPLVGQLRFIKGTLFVPCFLVNIKVVVSIHALFANNRTLGITMIVAMFTALDG